ncbi:hypothetical protein RchiOBHm_Chr2g0152751 [Rosa chinensis]|uniref:Uncharacterized protein n=1 Tax=Rosa chinensis TaxID=74649 RepID=A0A2P6S0I5_ROSCH|nr:hypothetical protein RchiOBHm_Chr2g0152751 [Rosa chinensis]
MAPTVRSSSPARRGPLLGALHEHGTLDFVMLFSCFGINTQLLFFSFSFFFLCEWSH